MKILVTIAAALVVAGCASKPITEQGGWQDGFTWFRMGPPAQRTEWKVVANLSPSCAPGALACAHYTRELCVIEARTPEAETPDWLAKHERAHCEGLDHKEQQLRTVNMQRRF